MLRGMFGLVVFQMAFASPADAQIIQAVNRFANAGEPEAQTNTAVENQNDDKGMLLLSQASAQAVGTDKAQIALQAVDLWLSRKTRFLRPPHTAGEVRASRRRRERGRGDSRDREEAIGRHRQATG